ncbi:MAG: OmpA family protein [Bacteroidales bacterium]|nr:OmpA family protein [Bacteroidales bacterium]
MKHQLIALLLFVATLFAPANAMAQEKESNNYFFGFGLGGMTVLNDGINSPTANFNISVGKYLNPVWGVRLQVGGLWQSLEMQDRGYEKYCKKFVETNFDGMVNVTNWLGGYNPNRVVDFSVFAGPTINFSSAVSGKFDTNYNYTTTVTTTPSYNGDNIVNTIESETTVTTTKSSAFSTSGTKTRVGAMVGFDLGFNCSSKWAVNLEGRFGVAPSIFGQGSDCHSREATARVTLGAIYTFGGKNLKRKPIIKEVVKEVIKEVPVVREDKSTDVKETSSSSVTPIYSAVFFKINTATLTPEGKVQIKLTAKSIKANPNAKFVLNAYADKNTGYPALNQRLTERRAKVVYDALIAEGVNPAQLEQVANGGVDTMFGDDRLTRVTIMEVK